MNKSTEARNKSAGEVADGIRWFLAIALLLAAMGGFYYWSDHSLLLRVVGLLIAGGLSVVVLAGTAKGRFAWRTVQEARMEVRKVIWPTRKETLQTTLLIIIVVFVMGLILWGLDGILGYLMRHLLGQGGT